MRDGHGLWTLSNQVILLHQLQKLEGEMLQSFLFVVVVDHLHSIREHEWPHY